MSEIWSVVYTSSKYFYYIKQISNILSFFFKLSHALNEWFNWTEVVSELKRHHAEEVNSSTH